MTVENLAYDLRTGYDLLDKRVQERMDRELDELKPDLLTLSSPCTHAGGWDQLGSSQPVL